MEKDGDGKRWKMRRSEDERLGRWERIEDQKI
jgi:hypothetical protein